MKPFFLLFSHLSRKENCQQPTAWAASGDLPLYYAAPLQGENYLSVSFLYIKLGWLFNSYSVQNLTYSNGKWKNNVWENGRKKKSVFLNNYFSEWCGLDVVYFDHIIHACTFSWMVKNNHKCKVAWLLTNWDEEIRSSFYSRYISQLKII